MAVNADFRARGAVPFSEETTGGPGGLFADGRRRLQHVVAGAFPGEDRVRAAIPGIEDDGLALIQAGQDLDVIFRPLAERHFAGNDLFAVPHEHEIAVIDFGDRLERHLQSVGFRGRDQVDLGRESGSHFLLPFVELHDDFVLAEVVIRIPSRHRELRDGRHLPPQRMTRIGVGTDLGGKPDAHSRAGREG